MKWNQAGYSKKKKEEFGGTGVTLAGGAGDQL